MIINVIIILIVINIKSTTQQLLSHLLWVDATSKDPLLLLLRQRGTICGFLRDLSSVASVTWLPWWHCHPSRYQHHHRHQDLRKDYQCGMIANIAIKNILTDSEHSVVLKEISVPLWDHDRCFFLFLETFQIILNLFFTLVLLSHITGAAELSEPSLGRDTGNTKNPGYRWYKIFLFGDTGAFFLSTSKSQKSFHCPDKALASGIRHHRL